MNLKLSKATNYGERNTVAMPRRLGDFESLFAILETALRFECPEARAPSAKPRAFKRKFSRGQAFVQRTDPGPARVTVFETSRASLQF